MEIFRDLTPAVLAASEIISVIFLLHYFNSIPLCVNMRNLFAMVVLPMLKVSLASSSFFQANLKYFDDGDVPWLYCLYGLDFNVKDRAQCME